MDDTYIILEWNGQHIQVNLAYLDLANVEDLKIFLAVQAYTDVADNFEGNMSTLPYDLLIFGVGALGGMAGAASCIQTALAGCGVALPSSIIAYAEAKNIEKKLENIVSARDTGEEKFLFLLGNASDMYK